MNYIARKIRKFKAAASRYAYVRRMTHPAFTHLLLAAPVRPVEILADKSPLSDDLIRRTCDNFIHSQARAGETAPSMWDEHETLRRDFIEALRERDTETLKDSFRTLFQSALLDGMSHGNSLFANEGRNPYGKNFFQLRTIDCLLSLAEAVGVRSIPSFAQMKLPDYVEALQPDYDDLLSQVEKRIGFSLDMPATGSPHVCRIGARRATAPDILRHAYVAHRLAALKVTPESRILEIGGGFGMLALCAYRAGYRNFSIIDLPFVGAMQMGYLGAALGAAAVSGGCEATASLSMLAPDEIETIPDDSVELVINCDSLPEIGKETALNYLRQIRRISRRFLSINQEARKDHDGIAQNWVSELIDQSGGFRRVYRFRHWMEQGYVEELYERV